jgi:chemotaxis methyl-accepting protein methylase
MTNGISRILEFVHETERFDFSGYHQSFIEQCLAKRLAATGCSDNWGYLAFLINNPDETRKLADAFTVSFSRFFRNTATFDYIADIVLPALLAEKEKCGDAPLRIWSAGCARGEEPYSVAILLHELLEQAPYRSGLNIFATDIDTEVLDIAREGRYSRDSVGDVKHGLVKKYFYEEDDLVTLNTEIRKMVDFSIDDITDKNHYAPPDSVFGAFDMVLCRNLLIYFENDYRQLIFEKIHRSLNRYGFMILGKTENVPSAFRGRFRKLNDYCNVYQKR